MDQPDSRHYTHIDATVDLLGGTQVLGAGLVDSDQLFAVTRAGLPKESIEHLFSVLDAYSAQDAATVAWLRTKLSSNDLCDEKLDAVSSEMTLRVAMVLVALIGVFEDLNPAIEFLLKPHESLDGLPPAKAVFTTTGVNAVKKLVTKGPLGPPA
jgi:uncharacterized protein (DUF2384 family)